MCKPVKKPTWEYHPEQRVPVGYIDKVYNYILLSEGDDPSGCYHGIWVSTKKRRPKDYPYIIIDKSPRKAVNGHIDVNLNVRLSTVP